MVITSMKSPTHVCLRRMPKRQNTTKITLLLTPPLVALSTPNFGRRWEPNSTLLPKTLIVGNMFPTLAKTSSLALGCSKIKCYPDGRVKKFKARFCAWRDKQQEGINYFVTWVPVIQWLTVRIVMTLALKLNLIFVQCNITAAFIHARVPVTETIHVYQPKGFNWGNGDEVLHLKRTLYGLKQSPRYFFAYITKRFIKQGLTASKYNPCQFMNKSLSLYMLTIS